MKTASNAYPMRSNPAMWLPDGNVIRYDDAKATSNPSKWFFNLLLCILSFAGTVQSVQGQCTSSCNQSVTTNTMPPSNNFSNTFCISTSGTLIYNQNFDMNGGTLCVGTNVSFTATGGNWNGNCTIYNYGTFSRNLSLNSGTTFYNYGTFTGQLTLNGGAVVNYSGATCTPSSFTFNSGSFTNNSGATSTFSSSVTLNSSCTLSNSGTMSMLGLTLNSGASTSLSGQTTINGSINNNGSISAGGLLTVTGNYNQNSAGVLTSLGGGQCNALNVTGTIQGQGTYNGINGLLLNKNLSPACGSCLINGATTTPPGAPANQITAPVVTASILSISGTITNPGGSPAATHYIVLRRYGTAVTDQPANFQTYTAGQTIGSSTVVAVNPISTTTFTDNNVISSFGCGTYYYAFFPINVSGQCGTYNTTLNSTNRTSVTVSSNSGTLSGGSSVCSGVAAGTLTLSGYVGNIVRWESSVSPFTTWNSISNTSSTYAPGILTETTRFRVIVNAGSGCSNSTSATTTVTVNSIPAAPAATGGSRCGTGSVTLSATPGSGETIDWLTSLGTTISGSTTASVSMTDNGSTYSVTYTAYARNTTTGCTSSGSTAIATLNPSPSISLSQFPAICSGTSSISVNYSAPVNSPDQYRIDWSDAANSAGFADVNWTSLPAGSIPISGIPATAGTYASNIYVRISSTGCTTNVSNGTAVTCGSAVENSSVTLTAPAGGVFTAINFASYGTPTGSCGSYAVSSCHAATSQSVTETAAIGRSSFTLTANNSTFGDPCVGTQKRLYIEAISTAQVLTIATAPTVTGSTGAAACGTSAVTLTATASTGATIDWYDASTGGSLLSSGSTSFTTPVISASASYYAEAKNTAAGCLSSSRTLVTATINTVPASPTITNNSRCGTGTLSLNGTVAAGETIDWYSAASGGTALASGSLTFTTPAISTTTTYYAAARNSTTGCVSTTRTAATATINPIPGITLDNFNSICAGTTSVSLNYSSPVNSPDQYMVDWSSTANAAGMSDISWTSLSGGSITINGLTSTAGSYAASILVRNSSTGCSADVSNETVTTCGTANERSTLTLTAPASGIFTSITFASYGTPTGTCGSFATSSCHAASSLSVVQSAAIGQNSFTISASNSVFGDPCVGIGKQLYIEAVSSAQILTINPAPTVTGTISGSRCEAGTVNLSATASSGAVIDWYDAASGGTLLSSNSSSFTTPSISNTTTYYAAARNSVTGCLSSTRTAVTATINTLPVAPVAGNNSRCGNGTVVITATPGTGETIDWYDAASGGTLLSSGSLSFTTPTISITTTYYAASRNSTTGCSSATRTAVTASLVPAPSITLDAFSPICSGTNSVTLNYTGAVNSPDQYMVDWNSAANTAGFTDVPWTSLPAGSITITGIISTAGSYGASIYVRNSGTGCITDVSATSITCGQANENTSLTMNAPAGTSFSSINFASYGTPTGSCGSFTASGCHASNSLSVIQTAAIGRTTFTVTANNATFGDPCVGTGKRLYVQAVSSGHVLTIQSLPTVNSVTNASRCGSGAVVLGGGASSGAVIDWYAAATGGTAISSGSTTYTTPTLYSTTAYYVQARHSTTGCISSSRTAVTATIVMPQITGFTPSNAGTGTSVVITGSNFTGATSVKFGGTNASSFTVNSATQITAVVGAGTSGSISITTTCGVGAMAGFTYYPAPTISSFTPDTGYTGTVITITGTNFTGTTSVSFGGMAASSFTVVSPTTISAIVASGATGSVSVTTPGGTATRSGFTYIDATTWVGTYSNSWSNPSNWTNGVPGSGSHVIIPPVETYPTTSGNISIGSMLLSEGTRVTIGNGYTLSLSGDIANNGSIAGSGTLILNGSTQQQISGTGEANNITLNNASGARIAAANSQLRLNGTYTPTLGVLITNDNLVLGSTASGTARIMPGPGAGNYIQGKVHWERYIPAKRSWRLLNFPFQATNAPTINQSIQEAAGGTGTNPNPGYGTHITGGSIADGFDQSPSNNASAKAFSGGTWINVTSTQVPVTDYNGLFLFVRGSRANNLNQGTAAQADATTLRGTGFINQGNQAFSLSGSGWQLIGNPFPCALDLSAIATTNSSLIRNNFKVWDPKLGGSNNVGGYVTASYNGNGYDFAPAAASSLSEFAQSGAAFFVDARAAGTLSILETHKSAGGSDDVFRPSQNQQKIAINLRSKNNNGTTPVVDGVLSCFDAYYSNELDDYDASKLTIGGVEALSILRGTQRLSIERRNEIQNTDTIPLQLSNMGNRGYQLELNCTEIDSSVYTLLLQDQLLNTLTPVSLSVPFKYDFQFVSSQPAERFRIILQKSMQVLPVQFTAVQVVKDAQLAKINWQVQQPEFISQFEVEHSSDGRNFRSTGALIPANARETSYQSRSAFLEGTNFYRIKAQLQGGGWLFSPIVKTETTIATHWQVYPNPVTLHQMNIQFKGIASGKYQIRLTDVSGKQCFTKTQYIDQGSGSLRYQLPPSILPGNYITEFLGANGSSFQQTIIVQ